jgi:transposase
MSTAISQAVLGSHASTDTKYHALYAFFMLGLSKRRIGELYGKDETTIARWIKLYEETGSCERQQRSDNVNKEIGAEKRQWVIEQYNRNPVMFLDEAKHIFQQKWGRSISCSTIWRILNEAGYTRKVIERRAMQIQASDICRFHKDLSSVPWLLQNLVFLDEVSFDNRSMMRRNGYGLKGSRILYRGEFCRRARTSLLCFLSSTGMLEVSQTSDTFTRQTFVNCLQNFALRNPAVGTFPCKNSLWIMDGARIHTHKHITTI